MSVRLYITVQLSIDSTLVIILWDDSRIKLQAFNNTSALKNQKKTLIDLTNRNSFLIKMAIVFKKNAFIYLTIFNGKFLSFVFNYVQSCFIFMSWSWRSDRSVSIRFAHVIVITPSRILIVERNEIFCSSFL